MSVTFETEATIRAQRQRADLLRHHREAPARLASEPGRRQGGEARRQQVQLHGRDGYDREKPEAGRAERDEQLLSDGQSCQHLDLPRDRRR
jgi:hypothetical protein